jgi:hypothetical protein
MATSAEHILPTESEYEEANRALALAHDKVEVIGRMIAAYLEPEGVRRRVVLADIGGLWAFIDDLESQADSMKSTIDLLKAMLTQLNLDRLDSNLDRQAADNG